MTIFKSIGAFASKHSSDIMTGVGIIGMGASIIFAVKNTPKAMQLIEARKEELEVDKLTPIETIKTTWKCYIFPASLFLGATGCLIGSDVIQYRRIGNFASAYALTEDILQRYKDKVIETLGEEKEKEIEEEVEKEVEALPDLGNNIQFASFGDFPCLDQYSKNIFWSTKEKIGALINKLNFQMLNENYISLGDYAFELGVDIDEDIGNQFGWNVNDGMLEPIFSSIELNNEFIHGRPVLLVRMNRKPDRGYDNLH